MAENYKHLYEQMKKLVEQYQDEIVPGMRKQIEDMERNREEVVRCKDCKYLRLGHAKPMTNADRIRAMTDEELARTISLHKPMYSWPDSVRKIYYGFKNHNKENPVKAWLEWLQQPVKEDAE